MQITYNPDLILTQEHTDAQVQNFTGSFCGFVLLHGDYDLHALAKRLQNKYDIIAAEDAGFSDEFGQDLMLSVPGALVTISFIDEAIPEGEAEAAAIHTVWPDAQVAVRQHTAHLMIAVLPDTMQALDAGRVYCTILSAALEDDAALAVYTSGTILEPKQVQRHMAEAGDGLPFDNLIFVGTYVREGGNCGYTVGMDAFGKDELELLDCAESVETITQMLRACAYKIITENKTAVWYMTIEVDGVQWELRRKDGVMVEGHSLQLNPIQ